MIKEVTRLKFLGRILLLSITLLFLGPKVNSAPSSPSVTLVDIPGLKKVLASHRGRVVLLNVWATWCPPCVKEFPQLIRLHKKYRAQGFEVVSVSADDPKTLSTAVIPFLKKQKPSFKVYIKNADDEAFIKALSKNWGGDLPASFLYDRQGRLQKAFTGEPNLKEMERVIKSLLTQGGGKKS